MKKIIKIITFAAAALSISILSLCAAAAYLTPSEFSVSSDSSIQCCGFPLSLSCSETEAAADLTAGTSSEGKIMLFGAVPVKTVSVSFSERKTVAVGGEPFGIRLYTDGLVVSQTAEVPTAKGSISPAEKADIRCGDIITSVNGEKLKTNEQLMRAVELSGGNSITLKGIREGREFSAIITPVMDLQLRSYRLGLWVRDSCAGIGTLTFKDEENQVFAGLGHGIYDSRSGSIMPLLDGDIVRAEINSVEKSAGGHPGSLIGSLDSSEVLGTISANDECGIYGSLESIDENAKHLPVAFRQEVVRGKAQIRTTIGTHAEYYDIEIDDISYNNNNVTKNMIIKITDERLLRETGGIVQGMSGSPIIQNGMLVGAVTHVFINDPSHGYGIFAENMINCSNSIIQKSTKSAS